MRQVFSCVPDMTESHDVVKFSRALVSALKRNWLLFAALAAFALLAATVGQWYLIPADSNADKIRNYNVVVRLPQTACFTSISGVVLSIVIAIGRGFKSARIIELLVVGIMLLASVIACYMSIIAAFSVPAPMKTMKVNEHTYHLAHRPTSDWDHNQILLYECADLDADCHLNHLEITRNLDGIDLRVDADANTIRMMIHDRVVFEHQLPPE